MGALCELFADAQQPQIIRTIAGSGARGPSGCLAHVSCASGTLRRKELQPKPVSNSRDFRGLTSTFVVAGMEKLFGTDGIRGKAELSTPRPGAKSIDWLPVSPKPGFPAPNPHESSDKLRGHNTRCGARTPVS